MSKLEFIITVDFPPDAPREGSGYSTVAHAPCGIRPGTRLQVCNFATGQVCQSSVGKGVSCFNLIFCQLHIMHCSIGHMTTQQNPYSISSDWETKPLSGFS